MNKTIKINLVKDTLPPYGLTVIVCGGLAQIGMDGKWYSLLSNRAIRWKVKWWTNVIYDQDIEGVED